MAAAKAKNIPGKAGDGMLSEETVYRVPRGIKACRL